MTDLIKGSYMQPNDVASYWPAYFDVYSRACLSASKAVEELVHQAKHLSEYVSDPRILSRTPAWTFFPPALAAGVPNSQEVPGMLTGGRTFLLDNEGAEALGIPPRIELDLTKLGWGTGVLECRPEVKGAGTLFARTLVQRRQLEKILVEHEALRRTYIRACGTRATPCLFMSKAMYLKRALGSQDHVYGRHAITVSESMLGASQIKFAPVWTVAGFPPEVTRNVAIVSDGLPDGAPRASRRQVNLVRFTPGNVRARYFDTAQTDDELLMLAARVTPDTDELWLTWHAMLADARRYLDDLAATTTQDDRGIRWSKVGDVNELFKLNQIGEYDAAFEYKNRRKESWFLSKDEVVVRRLGKVFVDLESLWSGSTRFTSADEQSLRFHHELVVLMVLRDHVRVCTAFRIAIELVERGHANERRRGQLQMETAVALACELNSSDHIRCRFRPRTVDVELRYPDLGRALSYSLPRWQIREPFPEWVAVAGA